MVQRVKRVWRMSHKNIKFMIRLRLLKLYSIVGTAKRKFLMRQMRFNRSYDLLAYTLTKVVRSTKLTFGVLSLNHYDQLVTERI